MTLLTPDQQVDVYVEAALADLFAFIGQDFDEYATDEENHYRAFLRALELRELAVIVLLASDDLDRRGWAFASIALVDGFPVNEG